MNTFEIGDRVWYAPDFGTGTPRATTIISIGEKDGEVVYDNDLGHYGTVDQYERRSFGFGDYQADIHQDDKIDPDLPRTATQSTAHGVI